MTDKPTPEQIAADPDRYLTLRNGAVYDRRAGHIVANPPGGPTTAITKETAAATVGKRWEQRRERFAEGFVKGTPEMDARATPLDAWERVGQRLAEAIHDRQFTNRLAENVRVAGEYGGFVPPPRTRADDEDALHLHVTHDVPPEVLELLERVRQAQRGEIIEAAFTDEE